MQFRSFLRILGPSLAVLCMIKTATALKADGEPCTLSSECATPCCTKKFSPGYPENGTWLCNSVVYNSNEKSCQGIPYKEYEVCDYSSQCAQDIKPMCCRPDDNPQQGQPTLNKCQWNDNTHCIPDPVVAVAEPSNPQILLQGDYCSTSNQCVGGCCRANADNSNKLACLASNSTDMCVKSSTLLGDYEFCSQSFMCNSGCCANNLSDDKKYKCWPKDGGANCMVIPAAQSNSNSTSNSQSMMPSSSTILLSAAFCLSLHGVCQLLTRAGFLGSK